MTHDELVRKVEQLMRENLALKTECAQMKRRITKLTSDLNDAESLVEELLYEIPDFSTRLSQN